MSALPFAAPRASGILGPDGRELPRSQTTQRPPPLATNGQPITGPDGFLLPHYRSFSAVWNAIGRTYRFTFDEALKRSPSDALAMRRDVTLLEILRERQLPVCQLKWHIEPEDPKDLFQQTAAESLQKIIERTPRLHNLFLNLLEAVWYGRYGVQLAYGWKTIQGEKRLCVTDHRPVNGDKIQFDYTTGAPAVAINRAESYSYPDDALRVTDRYPVLMLTRPEWRQRFIIHRHEIDDADYFESELAGGVQGVGIRHRIYWAWWLRNEVMSWMVDYLERVGLGLTVFYYDAANPASKAMAEQAAKEYSRDSALAWPRYADGKQTGSGIERIEVGGSGNAVIQGLIDWFQESIRRYIVGETLSSQAESTGLGSSVAELHADTKYRILRFDATNLQETLSTDFVGPLKEWNYGALAPWEMFFRFSLDKPDPEKQLEAVNTAYSMGVDFKSDEVRELTGLSKPEADDEIVGKGSELNQQLQLWDDMNEPAEQQQKKQAEKTAEKTVEQYTRLRGELARYQRTVEELATRPAKKRRIKRDADGLIAEIVEE